MSFAEQNATAVSASMSYESNQLTIDVDGALVPSPTDVDGPRAQSKIDRSCAKHMFTDLQQGLQRCAFLSFLGASNSAPNPPRKFVDYFRGVKYRGQIRNRFLAAGKECESPHHGVATIHCNDIVNVCDRNTRLLAYVIMDNSARMIMCNSFFHDIPAKSRGCRELDRGSVLLHEMCHIAQVYNPPCRDYTYEYKKFKRLSQEQSFLNANSYALFADCEYWVS